MQISWIRAQSWRWVVRNNMIIICKTYLSISISTPAITEIKMLQINTCFPSKALAQHKVIHLLAWQLWITSMLQRWMWRGRRWTARWWSSSIRRLRRVSIREETSTKVLSFRTTFHIQGRIWTLWQTVEILKWKWIWTLVVTLEAVALMITICSTIVLSTWTGRWTCTSCLLSAIIRVTNSHRQISEQRQDIMDLEEVRIYKWIGQTISLRKTNQAQDQTSKCREVDTTPKDREDCSSTAMLAVICKPSTANHSKSTTRSFFHTHQEPQAACQAPSPPGTPKTSATH